MASLQDIFNLAKADGGKFFVMDETGDPKLVIMDIDSYQELLLGKIKHEVQEVEEINKQIMRAQLDDVVSEMPAPMPLSSTQQKALFSNHVTTAPKSEADEVIDPSFDFEGPKVELEDL